MRLITKQAAKLEELEARRKRLVNRVAKLDLKIEEQKEKVAQYEAIDNLDSAYSSLEEVTGYLEEATQ